RREPCRREASSRLRPAHRTSCPWTRRRWFSSTISARGCSPTSTRRTTRATSNMRAPRRVPMRAVKLEILELDHERHDGFLYLDRAACKTSADLRHQSGALALAQIDGIGVRPLPARVALHAWTWAEMAGEARTGRSNDHSRRLIGNLTLSSASSVT